MLTLEFSILNALQTIHSNWLDAIMVFFTRLGDLGALWIVIGIALLFFKKYRKNGWILLFSLLAGLLIANLLLKNTVARVRPCDLNPSVQLLIARPTDWSFPSGHTTASFAAAAALLFANRKWGITAYIMACCIAFSRLYLYVHYPTDILGGMLIGTLSAGIVILIYKKVDWGRVRARLHRKKNDPSD